jgi:hypothetical protein
VRLDLIYPDSIGFPLIRLFDFDAEQAAHLRSAVLDLASERVDRLPIRELPCIVPINECALWFCIRSWDQGILQVDRSTFICGYTTGTWDNVAGLIEPFVAGGTGYQWLAGGPGEPALLLSVSGQW